MIIGNHEMPSFPFILAPMEDITDPSFRKICKSFGADMMTSEFISSEGLIRNAFKSKVKLNFEELERPFGIQIFGHKMESMVQAARIVEEHQPDFIDLNFGCPVKKVISKGAGAAMLKTPDLMIEIAKAVAKAVKLPVTLKTRVGWSQDNISIGELAPRLQDCGIAALSIHARTATQLYGGHADWSPIQDLVAEGKMNIPIIGNGDITTAEQAIEKKETVGVDGIMIGRGAIGNPWIFQQCKQLLAQEKLSQPSLKERIDVCKSHIDLSIKIKGEERTIKEMRKFYSGYFRGIPHFKPHRIRLLTANELGEVQDILSEIEAENL